MLHTQPTVAAFKQQTSILFYFSKTKSLSEEPVSLVYTPQTQCFFKKIFKFSPQFYDSSISFLKILFFWIKKNSRMILVLYLFQNLHNIIMQTHEGTLINPLKGKHWNYENEELHNLLLVILGRVNFLDISSHFGTFPNNQLSSKWNFPTSWGSRSAAIF